MSCSVDHELVFWWSCDGRRQTLAETSWVIESCLKLRASIIIWKYTSRAPRKDSGQGQVMASSQQGPLPWLCGSVISWNKSKINIGQPDPPCFVPPPHLLRPLSLPAAHLSAYSLSFSAHPPPTGIILKHRPRLWCKLYVSEVGRSWRIWLAWDRKREYHALQ